MVPSSSSRTTKKMSISPPSTPVLAKDDDPFCSSFVVGLLPEPSSDNEQDNSVHVVDNNSNRPLQLQRSSSTASSDSDDLSTVTTASRDMEDDDDEGELTDVTPEDDDDVLTFQTLDDESDYQSKLLFRKYHGPVADLGTSTTNPTPRKAAIVAAAIAAGKSNKKPNLVGPQATSSSSAAVYYPFWARRALQHRQAVRSTATTTATIGSARPATATATVPVSGAKPTQETVAGLSPPVVVEPIPVPASATTGPATPIVLPLDNINDEEDNDSGIAAACFPHFEAPPWGDALCHSGGGGDMGTDDVKDGGGGDTSDDDVNVDKNKPPVIIPASDNVTTKDAGAMEGEARKVPTEPQAQPSDPSLDEGTVEQLDESTTEMFTAAVASTNDSSNINEKGEGDGEDDDDACGSRINLKKQFQCAAHAIDQTVEAVLGLCVPEQPLACYGYMTEAQRREWTRRLQQPDDGTCFSWQTIDDPTIEDSTQVDDTPVDDNGSSGPCESPLCDFNPADEVRGQPLEDEGTTRPRWTPDDDLPAPAEGWATFPPKVEVTPQMDDTDMGSYGETSTINRNTKLIVSSTTEERDDTRVVTIVGMDDALNRGRRWRIDWGNSHTGSRLFGRWLLGPSKASHGPLEWESQIESIRQRSVLSSRSLDGSASRLPTAKRRANAKHPRNSWFRRLRPALQAPSAAPKENDGHSVGGDDNDDVDDAAVADADEDRSFRSRSTLSSRVGGEDSITLEWPEHRTASFLDVSVHGAEHEIEHDGSCHKKACHFALEEIYMSSMCSVTSSLGEGENTGTFLSPSWLWTLFPVRELRTLARAVGIEVDSDEDIPNRGNDGDGKAGGGHRTAEEGADGAAPTMQKFAPIHVKKGERHLEESTPSPPLSTITMLTLPTKRERSRTADQKHTDETTSVQSMPAWLDWPVGDVEGGEGPRKSAGSFVTEDERTVTDGDASIHTIRIVRIPTSQFVLKPLPLPPPRPSSSSRLARGSPVTTSASSWQPGLSARGTHRPGSRDGPPATADPAKSVGYKAKSLADDLSLHESEKSRSSAYSSSRRSGGGEGGSHRSRTFNGPRSPSRRSAGRRATSRVETGSSLSPSAAASSWTPSPSSPRSPKRSDRTPLLPKEPPSLSPTYSTRDETTTTTTFTSDDASQQPQQRGFVTTTLRIRRVPTLERMSFPPEL